MARKRASGFSAEFKKQVALEALRGDRTAQEVAAKHEITPDQVRSWKRQALGVLDAAFAKARGQSKSEHETASNKADDRNITTQSVTHQPIKRWRIKVGWRDDEAALFMTNEDAREIPILTSSALEAKAEGAQVTMPSRKGDGMLRFGCVDKNAARRLVKQIEAAADQVTGGYDANLIVVRRGERIVISGD